MQYTVDFPAFSLLMHTDESLFSPKGPDRGTMAMLSAIDLLPGQKVLDLGCGCGIVGLYAARMCGAENVWLTDIDPTAVGMARSNAMQNGIEGLHFAIGTAYKAIDASQFDWILSNPPYQSDFSVAKAFIEKGFNRLKLGGKLVMVTKRREWYRNKLVSIFGGVQIEEIDGYFVFIAERRSYSYAKRKAFHK